MENRYLNIRGVSDRLAEQTNFFVPYAVDLMRVTYKECG